MRISPFALVCVVAATGCGLTLDLRSDPTTMDGGESDGGAVDAGTGIDGAIDAAGPDAGRDAGRDAGPPRRMDAGAPTDARAAVDAGACRSALPVTYPTCEANADCNANEYCKRPEGQCFAQGTCEERIGGCSILRLCGCNGQTYASPCESAAQGVSVAYYGSCRRDGTGNPNWCSLDPRASAAPFFCGSIQAPCFDDGDCTGLFNTCVGSVGCEAGDQGYCVDVFLTNCYRDSTCGPTQRCEGIDVTDFPGLSEGGRCQSP